ncbi:MAG: PQQ-binding-like beta-propeller repeat protein [Pirellulaceae bacterium]
MKLLSETQSAGYVLCILLAILFVVCVPVSAADWSNGRANSQGTGATEDALPEDLSLLWEYELKGLGFDASPIIADGKVFANDHDGRIVALDLATGKELWKRELDTGFIASPAYRDGVLFAADYDGVIYALNGTTGKEVWTFESEGGEINGSPVFHKDSVLFTADSGTLFRLQCKDGSLVWKYETNEPILCGASLTANVTFLGGCDEHLHVVDLEKGTRIGDPVSVGATQSTPCVVGDRVMLPSHTGHIYQFEVAESNELTKKWEFRDDSVANEFRNSLAVKDGLAVGTSSSKRVFAIDIETGEVKWTKILRKRADASPIIAGDSVIAAAADGRLIRFDLQTGEETWMFEAKPQFAASPAASDGKLVAANLRGTIYCFGSKSAAP